MLVCELVDGIDARSVLCFVTKNQVRRMREMGVCSVVFYCADYKCAHLTTLCPNQWPMMCGRPI
jgi:hypothetical protein